MTWTGFFARADGVVAKADLFAAFSQKYLTYSPPLPIVAVIVVVNDRSVPTFWDGIRNHLKSMHVQPPPS